MQDLETFFQPFRENIIGYEHTCDCLTGKQRLLYADWAASGRLYRPIENYLIEELGPYVANTHTETNLTGTIMTAAYHQAHSIIKTHVNASPDDVQLFAGFGMTAAINKFQRILGLRIPERLKDKIEIPEAERPLVILSHMEHHSNQTTWEECCCDVVILCKTSDGRPNLENLQEILELHQDRKMLIGSFTACSNVTGILTPYHEMAALMHAYGGYCFVDFAASAPYLQIDMHPARADQHLDAIFFSPHKFLGGPGASGVIVFNKALYHNQVPDHPGGGTVLWTNPWGKHHYFEDIEVREDGGTPGFLQGIKAALAILLKEEMGTANILEREHQLVHHFMDGLGQIDGIEILEGQNRERLGYISFYSRSVHHNLVVKLLNDRFGIQVRGGCLCAGTYGHILLRIDQDKSQHIIETIDRGDLSKKPGWIRVSLHPTMPMAEVDYILHAIREILRHHRQWRKAYRFNKHIGDFEAREGGYQLIDLKETFRSQ